ncbi:hypothetical protein RIF29_35865 [Crotalaria pallida]|uniref:Uncharacterized protein n=1 Tax=Crotalaria pallida TaxID=3830 RepID=A0AAN9HVE7_CROPI
MSYSVYRKICTFQMDLHEEMTTLVRTIITAEYLPASPPVDGSFHVYASGLFDISQKNDEMPIGWPLGLGILNMRLRNVDSTPTAPREPYSIHVRSTSFSSFSSSNLDTESTVSFFQDKSVTLGRLIGIRPGERRGRLYFPNSLRFEEKEKKTIAKGSCSHDASKEQQVEMSGGICIPTLLDALLKINKSKKNSKN